MTSLRLQSSGRGISTDSWCPALAHLFLTLALVVDLGNAAFLMHLDWLIVSEGVSSGMLSAIEVFGSRRRVGVV